MTKRRVLISSLLVAMALCLTMGLVLVFGLGVFAAEGPVENDQIKIETLDDKSKVLNNGYLDRYGVPSAKFKYENNGEAEDGAPLSYAFDRNFNSVWRSKMQTDAKKPETINTVTVTFEKPTEIDRIVYQADSSWYDRGYFNTLKITYEDKDGKTVVCDELASQQTSEIVLVTLKNAATIKKITLEWTKVPTNHRTVAAASEIIFLQPESNDVEAVQNMFTDYAQLKLNSSITRKEDVEALREKVKNYASYETELNYLLTRAERVLDHSVYYDSRREMGTAADSANVLTQHGDVAGYARSVIKAAWFGTNRQATGVTVSPGEELIVYVTGDVNDPLPSIVYSQHWGSWRGWKSGEYKLRLGKNVIKVQSYLQDGYTTNLGEPLPAGGPVYLVNPYTPENQSSNVKVYIEGGDLFPIFRENGDVATYKKLLADYADEVARDREEHLIDKEFKVVDVTEIVSDRVILTVEASMANRLYNEDVYSPQDAATSWDKYIDGILQFDGVVLEDDEAKLKDVGAKYDIKNQWLNVNIRLMQPYGAAYAFMEHVGIQVSWEATAIVAGGFGWGYTHELGHMLDIGERTVSECSNNMVSKYYETVIEKTAQRGDFEKTTIALAPDDHIDSYWNTNRGNFIFWWLIESYYPGFWARLENLYRYENIYEGYSEEEKKALGVMNATEKQVYLSSLVVGEDLSYYFERWGYNLSTNDYIFKANGENTSNAFKTLMKKAKEDNRIKEGSKPKLWYLDAAEWWMRYPNKSTSELYKGTETPEINSITKSGDGYNLIMNVNGVEKEAHLGFEVQAFVAGEWKVIGFTYDRMFLDTTSYGNETPKYRVVAYDRALTATKTSAEASPAASTDQVCRIENGETYSSLYEAVAAAQDGDVITLLKDTSETGIVIDKNITIKTEGAHTVKKGGPQPIFTIVSRKDENETVTAGNLTIEGSQNALITFDGGRIETNNPLILAQGGTLTLKYCVLQNNVLKSVSNAMGGALRADGAIVHAEHTVFQNNKARLGGGVYIVNTDRNTLKFTDCTFSENVATEGGGFYNRGTVEFKNCKFEKNTAETVGGGLANMMGGVITLKTCALQENKAARGGGVYSDGNITLYGGTFEKNQASEEGAALCYFRSTTGGRYCLSYNADEGGAPVFKNNLCKEGAAVYLAGVTETFTAEIYDNDTKYALRLGGVSAVLSGGRYGGIVFKEAATPVTLKEKLPEAVEGSISVLTDSEETSVLLFTANFVLEDEVTSLFKTERGNAVIKEQGQIWLEMESYTVTFIVGEREEVYHYLPGHVLHLESLGGNLDQTTYVKEWKGKDNSVHQVGEEFIVNEDMTFTAVIENKCKIEFKIGNADAETDDIVYYVIPGESFTLPRIDPLKYVFNGWEYEGADHAAYETAQAQENRVYNAKLTKKLVVEYAVEKSGKFSVYETRYYPFGSKLTFVSCRDTDLVPSGGYINGFFERVNGVSSPELVDFDSYTVKSDLMLVADVVEISVYVMYSFTEGGEHFYGDTYTDYARMGSVYTITPRAIPTGYKTTSLKVYVDGEEYDMQGNEIDLTDVYWVIINADIEKIAYNITYQINGEFFKSETRKYGETMVLEDPTETLLREKYGDGKKYSFNSYQLVTIDPLKDIEDPTRVQEMNMMVGNEIFISEDITLNMLVYVEGEEKAPEEGGTEEEDRELTLLRLEKKMFAEELAGALIAKVSDPAFNISDEKQSEYVNAIQTALASALAEIAQRTTVEEMDEVIASLTDTLDGVDAEASLLAAKNDAKAKLRSAADVAKLAFENNDEKETYLSQIQTIVEEAEGELDAATSSETFEEIIANAKAELDRLVEEHGDQLVYHRESAKASASSFAQASVGSVNALSHLTETQKGTYATEIQASLAAAHSAIAEGTREQIDAALGALQTALEGICARASADDAMKAAALAQLREKAEEAKAAVENERTAACEKVDADPLLRNFSEVKDKINAFAAETVSEVDALLQGAENSVYQAEGSGDALEALLKGITDEFDTDLKLTEGKVASRADTLIAEGKQRAKDDAVKNDARPRTERLKEELNAMDLEDDKKQGYIDRLEAAFNAAQEKIVQATTRDDITSALDVLIQEIENIREAAERDAGISVQVVVSGIEARPKTYDGTLNVELDLSNVKYLNAETGLSIDPAYSANFVLHATATLTDKNAGTRTATLTLTLEGSGTFYVLAAEGQQTSVTVEIAKAKLTVTLDKDGNVVYSGFVGEEDEKVLDGELTVEYREENGVRMAIPGGLTSGNYDITFVPAPVKNGANLGLILGITIPVCVLAAAAVVIILIRRKKKQ